MCSTVKLFKALVSVAAVNDISPYLNAVFAERISDTSAILRASDGKMGLRVTIGGEEFRDIVRLIPFGNANGGSGVILDAADLRKALKIGEGELTHDASGWALCGGPIAALDANYPNLDRAMRLDLEYAGPCSVNLFLLGRLIKAVNEIAGHNKKGADKAAVINTRGLLDPLKISLTIPGLDVVGVLMPCRC